MRRFRTVAEVLFAVLFLGVAGLAVLTRQIPSIVAVAYGVVSVLTFLAYAIDKSAAQNGRWRTSEGTLHLLALAGGWPGALIAQQTLRHKSAKLSFRFFFWLTVLLNCAALVWLNTPDGQATLEKLHFFQL